MGKITNLLCGVLLIAVILCGNAEASKMECNPSARRVSITTTGIEGDFLWSRYRVDIVCFIQCSHHTGKCGLEKKYTDTLNSVKGSSSQAYDVGIIAIESEAYIRLREECRELACDCEKQGCSCRGCIPLPVSKISKFSKIEEDVQDEQKIPSETSISKPFVLKKVKNISGIVTAQQEYINKHYEEYTGCGDIYTMYGGRYIQIILIGKEGGVRKSVYFDMTDVYKKLKNSRDKATKLKVKELMEDHMPLEAEPKSN